MQMQIFCQNTKFLPKTKIFTRTQNFRPYLKFHPNPKFSPKTKIFTQTQNKLKFSPEPTIFAWNQNFHPNPTFSPKTKIFHRTQNFHPTPKFSPDGWPLVLGVAWVCVQIFLAGNLNAKCKLQNSKCIRGHLRSHLDELCLDTIVMLPNYSII